MKSPDVIVVGAGIVGASVAYHLTQQHARVTLIEQAALPAQGATGKSFGWITAAAGMPQAYFQLRQQAISDWKRVAGELNGKLKIDWRGALIWHNNIQETLHIAKELSKLNQEVRIIDQQEIKFLEPNLKIVPLKAMFAENEGSVDPGVATNIFINAARKAGARIRLGCRALALTTKGSQVTGVLTAEGLLEAGIVVLANAADAAGLCKPLNISLPLSASPAILMSFKTDNQFVNRVISNPLTEIRPVSPTLTLAAEDYIDESAENNPHAIAQRTLLKIKDNWPGAEQIELTGVRNGMRPIPRDGMPIVGFAGQVSGLYLSVMHSGVSLAPLIGRLAAGEISSGDNDSQLSAYRPARFAPCL